VYTKIEESIKGQCFANCVKALRMNRDCVIASIWGVLLKKDEIKDVYSDDEMDVGYHTFLLNNENIIYDPTNDVIESLVEYINKIIIYSVGNTYRYSDEKEYENTPDQQHYDIGKKINYHYQKIAKKFGPQDIKIYNHYLPRFQKLMTDLNDENKITSNFKDFMIR